MPFNTQEFSSLGQAQFDKAVRLSSIVLTSAERLATLQLDLARKLLADQAQAFKSVSEVKDPKALVELQSSLAQPTLDQAFAVARNVYDAAVATQNELSAFIEEQLADNNKTLISTLDRLAKNAPAGSDIAVSALKNLVNQDREKSGRGNRRSWRASRHQFRQGRFCRRELAQESQWFYRCLNLPLRSDCSLKKPALCGLHFLCQA
jgi:phasin family protein